MPSRQPRRPRPPLDQTILRELALAYVGRFATTKAKLRSYLNRKLRERGWDGQGEPDLDGLADQLAALGYVDDANYALSKSRALSARGYGPARVRQSLRIAGVADSDAGPARALAEGAAVDAALRFAARRRIGPFSDGRGDPKARDRGLAAMVRAGHGFELARAIVDMPPGASVESLDWERHLGVTQV